LEEKKREKVVADQLAEKDRQKAELQARLDKYEPPAPKENGPPLRLFDLILVHRIILICLVNLMGPLGGERWLPLPPQFVSHAPPLAVPWLFFFCFRLKSC